MFESICIRRQNIIDSTIDLGLLAESMLFYQHTRIIADGAILKQLINVCGSDVLLELLSSGFLQITYLQNHVGISTENGGRTDAQYEPVLINSEKQSLDRMLRTLLTEKTGHSGKARRLANRFSSYIEAENHEMPILHMTLQDFADGKYMEDAVIQLVKELAPEYRKAHEITFDVLFNKQYLNVETNINFQELNNEYHRIIPISHSSLDVAAILCYIMDSRADFGFAAQYNAELATNSLNSSILQIKIDSLINKHNKNEAKISGFQSFYLDDSRAIREVINSGRHSFQDLLPVLKEAKKFRHWLEGQNPDADLLKSYYHEVRKSSWIENLPSKVTRWALFQAVGIGIGAALAGPPGIIGGIALGAVDSFLLDRLLKGWKPNQFVEGSLKEFILK